MVFVAVRQLTVFSLCWTALAFLACGEDSPGPGDGVSGINLYASLEASATEKLNQEADEATRVLNEGGLPGEFRFTVVGGGSCTGLGQERTCTAQVEAQATSYQTWELESAVSSRATYRVRFVSGGCWRAKAVRIRNDFPEGFSEASNKVGFLGQAVRLSGCTEPEKIDSSPPSDERDEAADEPPPEAPVDATEIVPGEAIGPLSLGDSVSEAREKFGPGEKDYPSSNNYTWNVSGGTLSASFDGGEAVHITTTSSVYELHGVSVHDSYDKIRRALTGWDAQECPNGAAQVRLLEGENGPTTAWLFNAGPGIQEASVLEISRFALQPPCTGE